MIEDDNSLFVNIPFSAGWKSHARLTPSSEISLTLRVEIKMTPEKQMFFRGFL